MTRLIKAIAIALTSTESDADEYRYSRGIGPRRVKRS
jgi:hypothetical protein